MFPLAVAWREASDDLDRIGDRFGIDHGGPRMQVSIPSGLARSVGMSPPEVMEMHLTAIDVFPAGVKHPSIRERPQGVLSCSLLLERARMFLPSASHQ